MAPNLTVGRIIWILVFAVSQFGVISLVFLGLLAIDPIFLSAKKKIRRRLGRKKEKSLNRR